MASSSAQDIVQNIEKNADLIHYLATVHSRSPNELRIVLVGKTGVGKSATGNSLLGEKKFVEDVSSQSVTTHCESYSAERFGKSFRVVDTPGLFDTSMSTTKVTKEISRCVVMLSPGPHAFLIVLRAGRFTPEEQNTVTQLLDIFGKGAMHYIIIVFTYKDELDRSKKMLQHFINENQKLKELTDMCPVISIDNTKDTAEQAKKLIALVEETVRRNDNKYYTNPMLMQAKKAFELKTRQLQEDEQRKFEEKVKPMREKFENDKKAMEKKITEEENKCQKLQMEVNSGQKQYQRLANSSKEKIKKFRQIQDQAEKEFYKNIEKKEIEKNMALTKIQNQLEQEQNKNADLFNLLRGQMKNTSEELEKRKNEKIEELEAKIAEVSLKQTNDSNEKEKSEIEDIKSSHKKEIVELQTKYNKKLEEIKCMISEVVSLNQDLYEKVERKKKCLIM